MIKRSDLKKGMPIKINRNFKYAKKHNWLSLILSENPIKYGHVVKFHDVVKEAIEINFIWQGMKYYSYAHYKDLTVIDKIPQSQKKAVLFDENNLNI